MAMNKPSNKEVIQRRIAKLRMSGQTVMEANSLGVMVKATQIDQDIYRIYIYIYINTILMSTMLICSVRYLQYPMMNLVL